MTHISTVFRIKSAILMALLMATHVGMAALLTFPGTREQLPVDTWINGMSVAGLTSEEALNALQETLPEALEIRLMDEANNVMDEMALPLSLVKARFDEQQIRNWLDPVMEPEWQELWLSQIRLTSPGYYFETALYYEESALNQWADELASAITLQPHDARIWVDRGELHEVSEQYGRLLKPADVTEPVRAALDSLDFEPIEIEVAVTAPAVTLADLGDFNQRLTEYSTVLGENVNRRENIRLAGERINSVRLLPGAVFSFNETVGRVTAEDGYQRAPVIQGGRLVQGIGGGICQTSSTLYQAALRGGLQIVERSNHSLPVGYLPLGLDATIAYGSIDFRFANPYDFPVMIGTWLDEQHYHTVILGPESARLPEIEIEVRNRQAISPPVRVIEDPVLAKGVEVVQQAGKNGYRLSVFRLTGRNESDFQEELISNDYYRPVARVIRRGTGEELDDQK
ncbi:VanW family protein [Anoxynatronum buryatiense]|uniref:Vancomycin resistance protein YoaR, contains peptidoglycan-binding and VanW domains n=1 Tax=Anoxynatronum buryatiense TaxID=489973 RepID=A0AA45WXJ3_9CLOT|nr:VanW family protein [Anoxynatronum buryatiense]SMP64924.1 Vancomycin resistance protein YoaR, contains peptidoglycan-binding and VanW domains [Anoxynatronum buryatiense]